MASTTFPAVSAAGASAVASSTSSSCSTQGGSLSRAINIRIALNPKLRQLSSAVSRLKSRAGRSSSFVANSQISEVNESRQLCRPVTRAASVALYALVLYYGLYLLCSKVAGGSSDGPAAAERKHDLPAEQNADATEQSAEEATFPTPVEDATEFMIQVSNLVQLVDSRDIIELRLKQHDCEVIIRKKEAMPHPPAPPPVMVMQSPGVSPAMQTQPMSPAAAPPAPAAALPAPSTPAKSSHPPLKSPMAGTFYRSPGPGQPPFVKIGDKVNKGQVLCIIEAMKLMNEIEADQAGTLVEILAEDTKPVSLEQPLFVIEP